MKIAQFRFLILASLLFLPLALSAATVMVAVQTAYQQETVSPDSILNGKQLTANIEDIFMDELFNIGDITFNLPRETLFSQTNDWLANVSVDNQNLAFSAEKGGANALISCHVRVSEFRPDAPLKILACTISVLPMNNSRVKPQTWALKINDNTLAATILDDLRHLAEQLGQVL